MTRYTPLWLQAGSYPAAGDRRLISAIWPTAVVSGCAVTVQANMNLNVAAGWVVVPAANNTGSVLCASDAVEVVTLGTAPGAGTNRIDVVVCTVTSTDIGTAAGDAFSFTAVAGTPSASPVAPTVPAGSVAIAQVLVIGGQATVQAGNITDRRALAAARDTVHARVYQAGAWNSATGTPVGQGFDTVDYDPLAMWNAGSRVFKVPVAGIYLVTGLISVSYVAGSFAEAAGLKNGTAFAASANANNGPYSRVRTMFTGAVKCAAADTLGLSFFTNPGACTGNTGTTETFCAVDYLGTG